MEYGGMSEEHPYIPSDGEGDDAAAEAYSEMMADAALPLIPGHEVLADTVADEPTHENTAPPEPTNLDRAFDYIASIRGNTFGSFLVAIGRQEELSVPDPQTELDDIDPATSLAAFDQPETQAQSWQTNHDLNLMPYQKALTNTGLALGPDSLSPVLTITDGEKFADMLHTSPEGPAHATTREGIEIVIGRSLQQLTFDHTPTIVDDDYLTYGVPRPAPSPEESNKSDLRYRASVAQALFNANRIGEGLKHIGADPEVIHDLKNAHTADVEGVLGHWAVAKEWQLYGAPIQGIEARQWTQWLPEEWPRIYTFLDDLEAKAPADSRFVHDLAVTFGANVQLLMDDVYLPSNRPPQTYSWENDDYEFTMPKPSAEALAEREAFDREYRQTLEAVRDRMAAIAARYGRS